MLAKRRRRDGGRGKGDSGVVWGEGEAGEWFDQESCHTFLRDGIFQKEKDTNNLPGKTCKDRSTVFMRILGFFRGYSLSLSFVTTT